jgi:glycosyltransferase involved in cell wall biosynthesis
VKKNNFHIYYSDIIHESRIFKIVSSLEKATIFDKIFIIGRKNEISKNTEELTSDIRICRLGLPPNFFIKNFLFAAVIWYLEVIAQIVKEKPICINIHSASLIPLGIVSKIFFPKIILIYDTHELETETNGASLIKKTLRKVIEFFGLRFFNHIFTVSPSISNWYKLRFKSIDVSTVMNCPLKFKFFRSNYLRNHFLIDNEKIIFLYQGIYMPGRGIDKLIRSLQKLPDHAVLVLLCYGSKIDDLRKISEKNPRIFFHHAVSYEKIMKVTSSADCGISFIENTCLSNYYSLPNKLFEYVQARVPVIVSPTLDQSKFVLSEKIGIVSRDFSEVALTNACKKFMKLPKNHFLIPLIKAANKYNWLHQETNLYKPYFKFFKERLYK